MRAMPTSLHLSSLLETKMKKQTHLSNVMGAIAFSSFSYKPNPAAAQFVNAGLKTVSMLLMQKLYFAVNVDHADSHRHVETNGRSAVSAESDNDVYSASMLAID